MRRLAKIACVVVLLGVALQAGEVIDGIAATVDGKVILSSEVEAEAAYQCLLASTPVSANNGRETGAPASCVEDAAAKNAARERLIERALVEEQMRRDGYQTTSAEEVSKKVNELRAQLLPDEKLANEGSEDQNQADEKPAVEMNAVRWQELLRGFGLSEAEVKERVRAEMEMLSFIDSRFRPAHVEQAAVEQYYREQFVPKVPAGGAVPELSAVAERIREILAEQMITTALNSWLASLRQQSRIAVR